MYEGIHIGLWQLKSRVENRSQRQPRVLFDNSSVFYPQKDFRSQCALPRSAGASGAMGASPFAAKSLQSDITRQDAFAVQGADELGA